MPRAVVFAVNLVVFALVLGAATKAHAQTITLPNPETDVERQFEAEGRVNERRFHISREDCLQDDVFTFSLQLTQPNAQDNLEVWAGTSGVDCRDIEERRTNPRCWKLLETQVDNDQVQIALEVQDIVAQQTPDESGNGFSRGSADDCDRNIDVAINLYFMFLNANEVRGTPLVWPTTIDLVGPEPPLNVDAGIGDERIVVSWQNREISADDGRGFLIYCAESDDTQVTNARFGRIGAAQITAGAGGITGTGGLGGGGGTPTPTVGGMGGQSNNAAGAGGQFSGATGGTSGSGNAPATAGQIECSAPGMVPGTIPSNELRVCERVSTQLADGATVPRLSNGQLYAVAVSAVDDLDNPGPLSNVSCAVPEDLEEFFEAYRALGGKGGGGFCRINPSPTSSSRFVWGLVLAATLSLSLRRRNRES